ncbi:hypothetical protein Taro_046629, partial [Colocasia esculenta]|nr:hypothetical protein [Colocasia esculenta]
QVNVRNKEMGPKWYQTWFKNSAGSGSDRPSRLGFGPPDPSRGNLAGPCTRIGPARLGSAGSPSPARSASARPAGPILFNLVMGRVQANPRLSPLRFQALFT